MEIHNGKLWDDFRRLVRLQRARWTRLEPNVNELVAALNKAASEIIELNRRLEEAETKAASNRAALSRFLEGSR